jgi:hypothetical protein
VLTHYTPPKYRRGTGELTNPGQITAPEAGYRNNKKAPDKNGQGWCLVMLVDQNGNCWGHQIIRLHEWEGGAAASVMNRYQTEISPLLQNKVRVIVADGAFSGPTFRGAARDAGMVESCHPVSHADRKKSLENARKNDATRMSIDGYPNWQANGHREITCRCGRGSLTRRAWLDRTGKACARVEGSCRECGTISVTSGLWRRARNPDRFVRCVPGTDDAPDYLFGNPLTFNDQIANEYGNDRFGRGEGFHGTLASRFRLIQYKRWFRTQDQVTTDTALVLSLTLAMGLNQKLASPPPPTAPPPDRSV